MTIHISAKIDNKSFLSLTDIKTLVRREYACRGRVVINSTIPYYEEANGNWLEVGISDSTGVGTIQIPV